MIQFWVIVFMPHDLYCHWNQSSVFSHFTEWSAQFLLSSKPLIWILIWVNGWYGYWEFVWEKVNFGFGLRVGWLALLGCSCWLLACQLKYQIIYIFLYNSLVGSGCLGEIFLNSDSDWIIWLFHLPTRDQPQTRFGVTRGPLV